MRERNYVTMLDPFHDKYGKELAAGLCLASICMDVIWVQATLIALGMVYVCTLITYIQNLCKTLILVICDQIISCPIPLERLFISLTNDVPCEMSSTADYVGGSRVKFAKVVFICAQHNNQLSISNKE